MLCDVCIFKAWSQAIFKPKQFINLTIYLTAITVSGFVENPQGQVSNLRGGKMDTGDINLY
jgi:hypothetical protein